MPFEVPPLPYDYAALEPHIDEQTMRIHHDKHHQAYVDNANKALDGTEWADRSIESILADLEIIPEDKRPAVRNNVGGHANHSLFWEIMGPDGGGEPEGALAEAIDSTFEGFEKLKELVNDTGVKRFGSGWSWLVWDGTGLAVYSTANQDSPITNSDVPLLGIDVWEHAYYLKYQNRRPDYLAAWWNVVNWAEVGRRYEEARSTAGRGADHLAGPVEVVSNLPRSQAEEAPVPLAVDRDLVARAVDLGRERRPAGDLLSDEEERRRRVGLAEDLEHGLRPL